MKRLLFVLLCVSLLCACSENSKDEIIQPQTKEKKIEISSDLATAIKIKKTGSCLVPEKVAVSLVKDFGMKESGTSRGSDNITIESCELVRPASSRTDGQPSSEGYYVINFKNQDGTDGFSTVSADRRIPGVMSYVEHGCIEDTAKIGGMKMFFDALPYYLEEEAGKFNVDSILEAATAQSRAWTDYPGEWEGDGFYYAYVQPWEWIGYFSEDPNFEYMGEWTESNDYERGTILQTRWHQRSPYNDFLPEETSHGVHDKPLAGCVVIAALQVMAHYGVPFLSVSSSDWANFATQPECYDNKIKNSVAAMHNLINHSHSVQNGEIATGMTNANIINFLNSHGYIATQTSGIQSHLPLPFLMSGRNSNSGHMWVVDAVKNYGTIYYDWYEYDDFEDVWRVMVYNREDNYAQYLHCNWGWGPYADNDYFRSGVFNPGTSNYDRDFASICVRVR